MAVSVSLAFALAAPGAATAATTPLSEIGTPGSGAGQLSDPVALAFQPGTGNVYVAESSGDRISVFTPSGGFVHAFGWDIVPPDDNSGFEVCTTATGCVMDSTSGSEAGQMDSPSGVAFGPTGLLYVTDFTNNRIDVFNPAGPTFVHAFGWDVTPPDDNSGFEVCTAMTGCLKGDFGGSAGQLYLPAGLVFNGPTEIMVVDRNSQRFDVFDPTGPSFVRAFGYGVDTGMGQFETCTEMSGCQVATDGGAAGQLNFASGPSLDSSGNLHVADRLNARVSSFDISPLSFTRAFGFAVDDGTFAFQHCTTMSLCQIGDPGDDAGQLNEPVATAIGTSGELYVADLQNNRVSVFDPSTPSFTQAFGWGVADGDPEFQICTIATTCQTGTGGPAFGQISSPFGLAVDCQGALWTAELGGRVERFGEPGTPPCAPPPQSGDQPAAPPVKKKKCKRKRKSKRKAAATAKKRKKCKRKKKR
jgi:DNA-binding beta-propeller fold protein YncE